MPVEADCVAQAAREDRAHFSVEARPQDRRILGVRLVAGVTGGSYADVKHVVRPDSKRSIRVLSGVRKIPDDKFQSSEGSIPLDVGNENFFDGREI